MKFNLFNTKNQVSRNYENAVAYTMSPEMELYTAVVTTGLNDSFYESDKLRLERIKLLIAQCDATFTAKLAVYARTEMHLRSVPMLLCVELAKKASGNALLGKTVNKVVLRADEITELLACYQLFNQRTETKKLNKLSKQIQKGLAESFNRFDEYQFAKYNRKTDVKLKDALFLVHPKAKDEGQQTIFNKIASDSLSTPYTWETELSDLGKNKFANACEKTLAFTKKWEEMIDSKKIGYMAMIRNLRNILEANVSGKHIEVVCAYISNETAVLKSRQLPFRFLSAYREISKLKFNYTSLVLTALEDAAMCSAKNIKGFGYDTSVVIACDVSGSMQKPVSAKSSILLYDIGLMLAMLLQSQCKNAVTGMFGDIWKIISMPKNSILANVEAYYRREGEVGYSTNGHAVIEDLIRRKEVVDKVMLFTDTQMWNSDYTGLCLSKSWTNYRKIAPKAKLYVFDLAGYGQQPIDIKQNDVYLLAGWSDKIFDILESMENSVSALEKILQIDL
ncbi:TROVE domain-containing protein [Pedobacter sp. MC2016-24]|uniref:TROVE domain-containing protein n=1 Tax=Pedobacter sp. MC2016-24 TaxID=2780090 RepID=UPI0018826EA4|nr:TROVE domain-containing protein [Pedobacter sp. MC2016-24]MBE9600540.1 TROVE domain-containing protein [Pedobacter sp. MC2016-24]